MERLIITGGAGFIGSAVTKYLIKNTPHQIVVLDKLTYAGNINTLKEISDNPKFEFIECDICDSTKIKNILNDVKPAKLMHLAAESHVDKSITGPEEFIKTNIYGTYVLLNESLTYIKEKNVEEFTFHHISTDEVFGDLPHPDEFSPDYDLPKFSENSHYNPSSPYSASKASSDHLVRSWGKTYGLPYVLTNCSNNYGPYHFPEKLIPQTIINALMEKKIPVYGNGSQIRDWLYVDDHARALVDVLYKGKRMQTYNIGGSNEVRNIDVVKTICSILDKKNPHNRKSASYTDLIEYVNDRPGHDKRYAIDASKIYNDLKWTPIESFESGIEKTIEWYMNNEWWWKNV